MTTPVCKTKKKDNTVTYYFKPPVTFTPDIIEAMVVLVKSNMKRYVVCEKSKDNKTVRRTTTPPFALNYQNVVTVSGNDKKSSLNIDVSFLPSSNIIMLSIKRHKQEFCSISDNELDEYWLSYCNDLEMKAYAYVKIGESYQSLITAARRYVESGFDEKYAKFIDNGYCIDFAYLYSPPRNLL